MNEMLSLNDKFDSDHYAAISEPFFYFGSDKKKPIIHGLSPAHINHYFEYNLKQNPNDFTCHIQRIKYALHIKNQEDFFAALCDLFIILGQQGLSLRTRLLISAAKKLSTEQAEILSVYLTEQIMMTNLDFLPAQCFFRKEAIEYLEITPSETTQTDEQIEDIIETAESYIENSQFDTAEEFILKHLSIEPENEPLTLKLINLYKAMNHLEKFNAAFQQFSNCLLTSRHWDDARTHFLEKN